MKYIVAFIGKAGAGKDTIATELVKQNPDWNMIVSCTTRPRREGEIDGINYHYLTNEEFAQKVLNGDMLEATFFNDWHYGTMASSLHEGVNVGVFNPEGYDCLKEMLPKDIQVIGFYVKAEDKTRMLRQLNRETNPDVKEIVRRFSADEEDFYDIDNNPDYPIIHVNNGIDMEIPRIVYVLNDYLHSLVSSGQE